MFCRAQVIFRGKRRIFHDAIVHLSSLRGKGDEARRYHDIKTVANGGKGSASRDRCFTKP